LFGQVVRCDLDACQRQEQASVPLRASGLPKAAKEDRRFRSLLRKLVAVPKKEVDGKKREYREGKEAAEPDA
jgi:hypothetical protein